MTNPLLGTWNTPFGIAPFSVISEGDFEPAFDQALDTARAQIDAIAQNPQPADFANTIEALELAGKDLDQVVSTFFTLVSTDATPKLEALQRDFSPRLAAYSSEITMNAALFARIDALWTARDTLGSDRRTGPRPDADPPWLRPRRGFAGRRGS